MQILDKLLSIDPNYLFIGLMICFYLMEMADYWFHHLDHKNPMLWRQHRVHHSDTIMDG